MNDKNLELIPDKDGFLFEIEDHSYVLMKLVEWLSMIILLFGFVFIYFNGDILAMRNSGNREYLIVNLGFFIIVTYGVKMIFHIRKKKKEKIRFYTNYIYKESEKFELYLYSIEEGYISKYNVREHKMRIFNGYLMSFGVIGTAILIIWAMISSDSIQVLILFIIFIVALLLPYIIGIFIYSLLKTKKNIYQTSSLILLDKRNAKYGISIPLNIISKEEKQKIDNYIKQYLHTDINKIEKIFLNVPFFAKKNIKSNKRILEGEN